MNVAQRHDRRAKRAVYAFGRFRMDVAGQRLLSDTAESHAEGVRPLVALVGSGRLVPRTILSTVWPETYVGENVGAEHLDAQESTKPTARHVETVPKRDLLPRRGLDARRAGLMRERTHEDRRRRDRPETPSGSTRWRDVNIAYSRRCTARSRVRRGGRTSFSGDRPRDSSCASRPSRGCLFDKRGPACYHVANNELPTLRRAWTTFAP
jgi:hypothetical protein